MTKFKCPKCGNEINLGQELGKVRARLQKKQLGKGYSKAMSKMAKQRWEKKKLSTV